MLSGFGLFLGTGDLPRLDCESDAEDETTVFARSEGFLCVCNDGSTFRRPAVTASPLESWSKMAPMSELPAPFAPLVGIGGGGGALSKDGNGGGGGGPEAEGALAAEPDEVWPDRTWWRASSGSIPSLLFHVTPVG